jgi:hypothetical protein
MSKKKAKKSKRLIPKRIAGVKVPRSVRKGRFGELLASRTGQAMIAQAILGAGAVAAGLKAKDSPRAQSAAHKVRKAVGERAETVANATGADNFAYALSEAARSFAEALRKGHAQRPSLEDEANTWTPDYGAPERLKAAP